MTLKLDTAQSLIRAAFDIAKKKQIGIAVAIVDRGGRVLASARGEGVGFVNLEVAEKKAVAAVNFGAPTHAVLGMIQGDDLLMRSVSSQGSIVLLPGGFDIRDSGELAGAIGVAGGHYSDDQSIAEEVLATLG